jgi:hypothetical protein
MKIVIDTKDYVVRIIEDTENERFDPIALCHAMYDAMSEYINCPNHSDMIAKLNRNNYE